MNRNKYLGDTWEDFKEEIMTVEEQEALKARVSLMKQIAELRKKENLTQRDLSEKSGIDKTVIWKMETGKVIPRVDTFVNALSAMGYHLEIVPNKEKCQELLAQAK